MVGVGVKWLIMTSCTPFRHGMCMTETVATTCA